MTPDSACHRVSLGRGTGATVGARSQGHQILLKDSRARSSCLEPLGGSVSFSQSESLGWVDGALEAHLEVAVTSGAYELELSLHRTWRLNDMTFNCIAALRSPS